MNAPDPEALLEGLDPEQRQVASSVRGPMAVMAGAGTGKTRAITHRIAYGVATGAFDQTTVLAVTFTQKAAAEMRSRLSMLGVTHAAAQTFHAAALRQLQYFWPTAVGGRAPQIEDHKVKLVAAALARTNVAIDRTSVRDVAAEIEWAKVNMIGAGAYEERARYADRPTPAGLRRAQFADVMGHYEHAKRERGVMDFEDVLHYMVAILGQNPDITREVQKRYRTFVVDEYQDVSPLQHKLLSLWLGNRDDICVVGDVAQTIYSFAGATPRYLQRFAKEHPGATILQLNRDYRSTPQIVSTANHVLDGARTKAGALEGSVRLKSQRPSGGGVAYRTYASDVEEAESVAVRAADLHEQGIPLSHMAVLYRTNAQSEAFEKAFTDRGLGVVLRGGQRFFQRDEVKRALVVFRGLARAASPDQTLAELMQEAARDAGWTPTAPAGPSQARERWDNLQALIDMAAEREGVDIATFVGELDERRQAQAAPAVEGVTLSTLHAAKGLEWDVVFLTGLAEGQLPSSQATTPEEREEERRLLYVGVTRARDVLEMSWAKAKGDGQGRRQRRRSRLLAGVWPEEAAPAGRASGSGSGSSRRRELREEAERFGTENPPEVVALYEALRAWRGDVAAEAQKPAYVVFSDQTLRDIAVLRPTDLRQLATVKGVGDVKLNAFGDQVLSIVRDTGTARTD